MNKLPLATRASMLRCLTEGMGVRATARVTNVSKGAVLRLLKEAGEFCQFYSEFRLRNLTIPRLEMDEQWSFVGAREGKAKKPGHGDIWLFACLATDTKLVVSWFVGDRTSANTHAFVKDVAGRTVGITQITTDGWKPYREAISKAFTYKRADYAIVLKEYESEGRADGRRYAAPVVVSVEKFKVMGKPNMELATTSYIENMNLHTRMRCKRYARLTNAHSKTVEHHTYAVALNFFAHNFMRAHETLTKAAKGVKTTPAMLHGLATAPWSAEKLAAMCDPNVTIE